MQTVPKEVYICMYECYLVRNQLPIFARLYGWKFRYFLLQMFIYGNQFMKFLNLFLNMTQITSQCLRTAWATYISSVNKHFTLPNCKNCLVTKYYYKCEKWKRDAFRSVICLSQYSNLTNWLTSFGICKLQTYISATF